MTENNFHSILAIASGKGGVGKSTVSVNLALALVKQGHRVGLLDADIYGPSQHIMLGLKNLDPVLDEAGKLIPPEKFGLKMMSFGFFVKSDEAVIWRGPMISRAFQQLVNDVKWGELDYLLIDLPPGTGDIQLTLTQSLKVTGIVIVTTPQDVALADAIKGINMFRKVNVPIIGLIENMSSFLCPHCGHDTPIFSKGGGKSQALKMEVPFLGALPLEETTRIGSDEGMPVVVKEPEGNQAHLFSTMVEKIRQEIETQKSLEPKEAPKDEKTFAV